MLKIRRNMKKTNHNIIRQGLLEKIISLQVYSFETIFSNMTGLESLSRVGSLISRSMFILSHPDISDYSTYEHEDILEVEYKNLVGECELLIAEFKTNHISILPDQEQDVWDDLEYGKSENILKSVIKIRQQDEKTTPISQPIEW